MPSATSDTPMTEAAGPTGPPSGATATAQRKITATLYYVAEDGMSLIPAQREITFGEAVVDQARFIVEAQLAPVQAPKRVPSPTTSIGSASALPETLSPTGSTKARSAPERPSRRAA